MSKSRDIADSAATINYIDNVTSDVQSQLNTLTTAIDNVSVTSGTLTKTFTTGESSTINLTSSVLAPVVSVTKEVPQSGVTNNNWDVSSTTENYTRLNSAPATTLDWASADIDEASYASKSFSVSSQESVPNGAAMDSTGTKIYILGTNKTVYQYSLSTPYDISSASYSSISFSVSGQVSAAISLTFGDNGLKMYVSDIGNQRLYQYTLSTAWNVSSASYDSVVFNPSSQDANIIGVSFNANGTKMFMLGTTTDTVYQYTLSTAWDVSTASYDSVSFSIASQEVQPLGMSFNSNGSKFYVSGSNADSIFQYNLSTPFNLSTASYSSSSLSVSSQDTTPRAIMVKPQDDGFYLLGGTNDSVYQYTLPKTLQLGTGSFASADVGKTIEANDGVFVLAATDGSYVETTAPTSYDQVASGSWEMYGVVYNAADGDLQLSGLSNGYDIANASYASKTFSMNAQDVNPAGIAFNLDGTKMFVVGRINAIVSEYTLSTAYDVSTASFVDSFSISAQEAAPYGLAFNADGTLMFIVGNTSNNVRKYTLSAAFDVSTASLSQSYNIGGSNPFGLAFNTDGTKMFVSRLTGNLVTEYSLSTAYDLTTVSLVDSFTVQVNMYSLAFSLNGKLMYTGGAAGILYEYSLTTGFDVSTASFTQSLNTNAVTDIIFGIAFISNGTKLALVGSTNDAVFQYDTGVYVAPVTGYQPVHTTNSIDSTYWTDINSMTADQAAGDGNVYYAISTDDRTTWTVIDNTDGERDIVRNNAGTWQYNSNATYASETWTNATTNTELAALAEAMDGVEGGYGLANATYTQNFSVSAQDSVPTCVRFNSDGTKMFVVGSNGDDVNEYTLSVGFDVSTASFVDSFSVSAQDGSPYGLAFNSSGTKMFIVGLANDTVYQYTLSTGFDVSTASYDSLSFSVAAQDTAPNAIAFNSDGTKMFIVGATNDSVYEYTLSTAFNISTASFVDSFSLTSQGTGAQDLFFNADGTKMFVADLAEDAIFEYTLTTGFDISTASYANNSFSVAAQEPSVRSIAFSSDGTKMFVTGNNSNAVSQYTTLSYTNQMDKTQLDAVTDPNHIALGDDLDLSIIFNMTSGTTVPSSDGVAINYDANVLNKGAVLGTDYDFDAPAGDEVRITALTAGNFKVRVV